MSLEPLPAVVAHCDWSKDPKKRWMSVAVRKQETWTIGLPESVGDTRTLVDRLGSMRVGRGALVLGFDFPIGLPTKYGELTGFQNFKMALRNFGLGEWEAWFDVCNARDEISVARPFYPMRPGGRRRDHLFEGLGLGYADLLRRCEQATETRSAACCLFWTLGGNQVGKGAISGWQEVIAPNLDRAGLWPFDGRLQDLLQTEEVILLETYPGDVYAQIGLPLKSGWSKTKQDGRKHTSPALLHWFQTRAVPLEEGLIELLEDGFSSRSIGEDQFDALVGLLGMLDVVDGNLEEGCPSDHAIGCWEGWILGQTALRPSLDWPSGRASRPHT